MKDLRNFLNSKAALYNHPSFIANDPICIPHLFTQKQDIEIAGLFAAVFAWGNRTTIINKCRELMQLMNMQPYQFCQRHTPDDLKRLKGFKHRTFNYDDLLFFIEFFHRHYKKYNSLEDAFFPNKGMSVEAGLNFFKGYFFSTDHLIRTQKHISSPLQKSGCKRLNMFLRWMVREDHNGVDFGIWKKIKPASLICPVDVHVARVAKKLGLLHHKQPDWQAAIELTDYLRTLDAADPVKYDFALFGLGVMEKF
jgi:uncharacterized protein (TIGR02757 family)